MPIFKKCLKRIVVRLFFIYKQCMQHFREDRYSGKVKVKVHPRSGHAGPESL